jgi:OmpA-OmpF porin, OOP family
MAVAATVATLFSTRSASAQQHTFKLDRLEIPGAPEDGLVLFRPVTQPKPIFFAQLSLGYSLHPLHASNVTTDKATLRASSSSVVSDQLTTYGTVGFQFLNRVTVGVTLPVTLLQDGQNPNYATGPFGGAKTTTVDATGAAMNDVRVDLRAVLARTKNEKGALGAGLSIFAPTGSVANFGGDGTVGSLLMVAGEYDFKWLIVTANTGVHFRPKNSINNPAGVPPNGLGIGNEWRWAAGAFIPIKGGKYRIGGTIFGQTGIESDKNVIGDTIFTKRNTPIEWNVEGRMKFGPTDRWWVGAGGGTLIGNGYGAPDFRMVALVGTYFPIVDSDANSPDRKAALREKWHNEHTGDADKDGIPDDIDACPSDPEDHQGSDPNDGCPMPPDKDGDGIPDQYDKCPDQPEDKDGIDDGDGCPEDDADKDGVPDTSDACPREPGQPSPDPKKNGCPQFIKMEGSVVRILQQVHFATGSDVILPESFPMLQEIANLLKANQSIKKMSIEGHTDNRGSEELNTRLSAGRASSVMKWLSGHGVEEGRLDSQGFGPTKPIEENSTDKGRAANRRVEFRIVDETDTNKIQK